MAQVRFTTGRLHDFQCQNGKSQSFLWDSVSPGLGLRVTASGAKSYIFQAKVNGHTIRITIGDLRTWDIGAAQAEARRLKVIVDSGKDPRKLKADELAAKQAVAVAKQTKQLRDSITLGDVWSEYIADRLSTRQKRWSDHHLVSHYKMIQAGGTSRTRSPKLTKPGPLFSLSAVPLVDLTSERIEEWAKTEAQSRPSSARLAWRLLKACMNWCSLHKKYASIVSGNPTRSSRARESLGRPKQRNDVLQRDMLRPWFAAVRNIGNPVIAAYLQTLLLTGARREELAALKWVDVNFQWGSIRLHDKVNDVRMIPLTPFVAELLLALPRRNEFVFSSPAAAAGYISEPRHAHNSALAAAGLPALTLHGLRRSFASLGEWVKMPPGIGAQIQGHAPQGVREQNYIRRPLDLLYVWHVEIENWFLEQAGIEFKPTAPQPHIAKDSTIDESMCLAFVDTEFTNFDHPELISIGFATSLDRDFYAEVSYAAEACSNFVREVVIPLLTQPKKLSLDELRSQLLNWLNLIRIENRPVIICHDSDYDRTLFLRIFENNPPKFVVFRRLGYRHINGLLRYNFFAENALPEHHALNDAMALRYAFRGWARDVR